MLRSIKRLLSKYTIHNEIYFGYTIIKLISQVFKGHFRWLVLIYSYNNTPKK